MGRNSLFFAKMDAKITFLFRSLISVVINLVSKSEISTGLEFFEKKKTKKNSQNFWLFFLDYVLLIKFNYDLFVYISDKCALRSHENALKQKLTGDCISGGLNVTHDCAFLGHFLSFLAHLEKQW